MKKIISFLIIISALLVFCLPNLYAETAIPQSSDLLKGVQHLTQSTVRIEGSKTIYIDPIGIEGEPKDADIVFVTHTHGDHFSTSDIKKLLKKDGILVITADGVSQAKKDGITNIVSVAPNKTYAVKNIKFDSVPAYNINKDFHTKSSKWVGYIISMNNIKYYHAGDTDIIPEMKNIKADVAFLPVGGTYTMTSEEAIKATNTIKPKVAVPIHYADVVGTADDAQNFVNGLDKKIKGVVLKDLLKGVQHLTNSTIRIQGSKVIYFDPINITGEPKDADFIFITHTHGDHFSINDIKKLMKKETVVVIPQDGISETVKQNITNVVTVLPQKSYEIDGLKFKTTSAYNIGKDFHKKDSNWVGYIVNINNINYYDAGDTDLIPEMKDIKTNVAFLPVGGTYTMNAADAANAANLIKPLAAVPIHFADVVGTWDDANKFVSLLNSNIKGQIVKQR